LYYVETNPFTKFSGMLLEGNCQNDAQISQLIDEIRGSDAIHRSHQEAISFVEGCLVGFEPTTSSSTVRRSAVELQAP
jgi:hypothetical protein